MAVTETEVLKQDGESDYSQPIELRKITMGSPLKWLEKGISDFTVTPLLSLTYGFIYAAIGLVLIALTYKNPLYTLGLVTTFYIVGPVIAVGLYCMSRHIEAGVKPDFNQGCKALCYNPVGIFSFSIIIGMFVVFWTIIAATITALFFSSTSLSTSDNLFKTVLELPNLIPFLLAMLLVGGVFSVICFSLSAISIPLMTHRKVDVVTAIVTSVKAVLKNPMPMLLWAVLIGMMILLGFVFAFVGIAVTLPIVGHASWHAYRELVKDDQAMTTEECDLPTFPFLKGKVKI